MVLGSTKLKVLPLTELNLLYWQKVYLSLFDHWHDQVQVVRIPKTVLSKLLESVLKVTLNSQTL